MSLPAFLHFYVRSRLWQSTMKASFPSLFLNNRRMQLKTSPLPFRKCVVIVVSAFAIVFFVGQTIELINPHNDDRDEEKINMKDGNNARETAIDSNAFYPVDSGQDGAYWPIIPDEHWNFIPRVSSPWNSTRSHSWCGSEGDYDKDTLAGLIYSKNHKAASSTLAGVTLRAATNYGRRQAATNASGTQACASYQKHGNAQIFHRRDRARSFMYSSIRHPAHRAVSWIFYFGSISESNVDEEYVLSKLRDRKYHPMKISKELGAQVQYMHTGVDRPAKAALWTDGEPTKVQNLSLSISRVEDVMGQYDFIVIVERLHESLVVFQLLLGLNTSDILYLSAKTSGLYSYNTGRKYNGCHLLAKSFTTPAISAYLSSPMWYARNYDDYLLYLAANRSLDLTIDSLGRPRFNEALNKYENMMQDAKICEKETITPCTADGAVVDEKERHCYVLDWGCGYPCLDRLFGI